MSGEEKWKERGYTKDVKQSGRETKLRKPVATIPFDYCTQASLSPP